MKTIRSILRCVLLLANLASAQITHFPYVEHFDTLTTLQLPAGWTTTTNKNPNGDFAVTTTSVRSAPHAVSSADATRPQSLIFPVFEFSGVTPDSLVFYERRTSTHRAKVMVEASIDDDTLFTIPISREPLTFLSGTAYVRRAFALPESLSDRTFVRFRLRIIADTAGATGVYRIDDVLLTKKKRVDAAVHSLHITPTPVRSGDSVSIAVGIRNFGLPGILSGTIILSDSTDVISAVPFQRNVASADTFTVILTYPKIAAGIHPLIVSTAVPGDEDTTNNSITHRLTVGYVRGTVLINEVMYSPSTGAPEWAEFFVDGPTGIDIGGWRISDATSNKAAILPQPRHIPSGVFFIVATDTTAWRAYHDFDGPLLFQAAFSSLNNCGDAVVLYDLTGSVIDSLFYNASWGGTGGRSLERIDLRQPVTDGKNWGTSKHPLGSTPGKINSLSQKPFDAAVTRFSFIPALPTVGQIVSADFAVKNVGTQPLSSVEIGLFIDADADSLPEPSEEIFRETRSSLAVNDSIVNSVPLPAHSHGYHRYFLRITTANDDDTSNNFVSSVLTIGLPPKSVVISEILYAPSGDGPEWIECFNNSPAGITLSGWKISDAGQAKQPLHSGAAVPAKTYFVITSDTAMFRAIYGNIPHLMFAPLPSLNNTTPDAVVVTDDRGLVMDSVMYRPSWGGENGQSLQRYDLFGPSTDSVNWRSGVPSPGEEFLFSRREHDLSVRRISVESAIPSVTVSAVIVNEGRSSSGAAAVHFFYDRNRDSTGQPEELFHSKHVPTLLPLDSTRVATELSGISSGEQHLIAVVEYDVDELRQNNWKSCTVRRRFPERTLVINEILFEPTAGSAEFVELHNPGTDTVDLFEWTLMDQLSASGSRSIIRFDRSLPPVVPGGYVVIASDSSVLHQIPPGSGPSVVFRSVLSLSNSGEDLVLSDLTGARIDSLRYSPAWHLKHISPLQRSLERIDPNGLSADGRNWSSSVASTGSTPLSKNSIETRPNRSTSLSFSPNPFSPDGDGSEDFLSINFSLPSSSSTVRIRIFDVHGRLIRRLAAAEPTASPSSIIWNGADDHGETVRIGMYIIVIEALDNFGGVITVFKDVAVVAKKL